MMIRKIRSTDKIFKLQGWNAVILFDDKLHSINMLRNGRVEIRYSLEREHDFVHNQINPFDYNITFDSRGYAVMT
jgi:hypothetical protein